MTHAAGFLSQPLLHLLASLSHFHPSLAGQGVKYPAYRSPAPQGLQCSSWAGACLPHTTHPTTMGDGAGHGLTWPQPSCCSQSSLSTSDTLGTLGTWNTLSTLGILETLCILGILGILSTLGTLGTLGILSPETCFQKLAFWEILKPRVFLGHLLRESHAPVDASQLWAGVKTEVKADILGTKGAGLVANSHHSSGQVCSLVLRVACPGSVLW